MWLIDTAGFHVIEGDYSLRSVVQRCVPTRTGFGFSLVGLDGRDGIAVLLRFADDHIDPSVVSVVTFLILSSSVFLARLVPLRRSFRSRVPIGFRGAIRIADEVLHAGHLGEFSRKQLCGQSSAENFAVHGGVSASLVEIAKGIFVVIRIP